MRRRDLIRHMAVAGVAAPTLLGPTRLLAATDDEAVIATVHPELRAFARTMWPFVSKMPPTTLATLPQLRQAASVYAPKQLPEVAWEKRGLPGGKGLPEVGVYLVNARAGSGRPAIVYTHGGGFVAGSAKDYIGTAQQLAKMLDCLVVLPEYRLAPETTYAGSIEDNYAALKWTHTNAGALGIDPARIAVMGESAGGGHAALLAIAARDRGEVPVCFQCLVYPMLDDRTGSSRTVPWQQGKFIWTPASNRFGWHSFLGIRPGGATVPGGAVPARLANLAGLPPAWIGIGSIDLFVEEDIEYARRLNDANVPAQLVVVPGAFHGFDTVVPTAKITQWFTASKLDALRRAFGQPVP